MQSCPWGWRELAGYVPSPQKETYDPEQQAGPAHLNFCGNAQGRGQQRKATKYAQNKRHGMYEGTVSMMNLAPERCSAPKTANGMAKHKLLKARILSRRQARPISVLRGPQRNSKSRMPALHIETAV